MDVGTLEAEVLGGVEVAEQRLIVGEQFIEEPQGAQEGGAEELALTIDTGVEQALGVQFELDPAAAIGNDLGAVEGLVGGDGEEDTRAAMQLRHDHALGTVDDEGAAVGHGGDVPEIDLGLLALLILAVTLLVLVELVEAHADLQGRGHGGAALHTLLHAHLGMQAHGLVTDIADGGGVLVAVAALGAVHRRILGMLCHDVVAAALAGGAEMGETFVLAALAGPMAYGIINEFHLKGGVGAVGVFPVMHGEHGFEDRLESAIFPLLMEQVHLQELVVAAFLDIDQVRNRNERADLRKLDALTIDVLLDAHDSLQIQPARTVGRSWAVTGWDRQELGS